MQNIEDLHKLSLEENNNQVQLETISNIKDLFVILNLWVLFYTFSLQPVESMVGICLMIFSLGLFYILKKENKYES